MQDRQHLAWLLEGVDSWNRRRNEEDFVPNLDGADINAEFGGFDDTSKSQIPLEGINLSKSKLSGANLSISAVIVVWSPFFGLAERVCLLSVVSDRSCR